nr:type III PLP-dependent enzyme [Nioella nitratireducens]
MLTDFSEPFVVANRSRAEAYIAAHEFDRPTLVVDTEAVADRFGALSRGLGDARIHYAVKANPEPAIVSRLVALGSGFDAASRAEIELCLEQGADPSQVSFGNTVKKPRDIAYAHAQGIRLFAADAEEELEKIAEHAPGAQVYIRLIVEFSQADWPLTRKFGCARASLLPLFARAVELGLEPVGLSFHVGSQTRRAAMWAGILDEVSESWSALEMAGYAPWLLNIGGGFPAFYGEAVDGPEAYGREVRRLIASRFGETPVVMAEPGRGLVAEAGAIAAEVLLVSRKSENDLHRWVFLDIGKFSGLAETMDEAIRYQFLTDRDDDAMGACILAGPSCDSADVLYEKRPVFLPQSLRAGDRIVIRCCGAYTTTYASIGFNGFPPLDVVVI